MSYKLLYHARYARETTIYDFDLLTEVSEYLYSHIDGDLEDYELFKVSDDQFDLSTMMQTYISQRADLRARALAKLNDTEKALLGLTKA